jgi:hypothetical protein
MIKRSVLRTLLLVLANGWQAFAVLEPPMEATLATWQAAKPRRPDRLRGAQGPRRGNIQEIFALNLDRPNLKQITKRRPEQVSPPTSLPTGRSWFTPSSWWEDMTPRTPRPM